MDLSYNESINRMSKDKNRKKTGKDRMELNTKEFFNKVRNGYVEISKTNPKKYLLVDATQSSDSIHNLIWKKIRKEVLS